MGGFAKFQKAMIEAAQHDLKPLLEKHREELSKVVNNHVFNLEGSRQLNRHLNAREKYFGRVFRGFIEISTSLETLEDIAFYIRRFPFENTHITRERYLQFHVEAHYGEIYIIKERLASYIKILNRQFKRDKQLKDVQNRCDELVNFISKTLEGVVNLRGLHIHKFRFDDESIGRLSSIGLLRQSSDKTFSKLINNYYRLEYKRVRKIWRDRTRKNILVIRKLLDTFFDVLFPVVFDPETGVLRIPRGIRTKSTLQDDSADTKRLK